jgi:hypothetical protein
MSTTIKFIVTILIIALIIYLLIKYIYGKSTITDLAPDKFSLSEAKSVYSSNDVATNLLNTSGSSIMAFVNVNFGDRTASSISEYQSVIGVDGVFSLDISPTSSQLTVITSNGLLNNSTVEKVKLPTLPLQKWVFVSILRDGRRFDVMYDDQIVASHRLEYYPKNVAQPLIVGNKKLLGNAIHVLVAPYRLTPTEVSKQRGKLADMNGKPVGSDTGFGLPPIPYIGIHSICLPGFPCDPVSSPPSDTLKAWYTPYS